MSLPRASGVLCHPTSLPGRFGIGDLGPEARRFIGWLAAAGQRWWQVLPLGPTGFGDSPYQCFSSFAGNSLLVSPELLLEDGLLDAQDLDTAPCFPAERVDFATLIPWKRALLKRAAARLCAPGSSWREELESFRRAAAAGLEDFALFLALKDAHGGAAWSDWPTELATREPTALRAARNRLADAVEEVVATQFLFFRQWQQLKSVADSHGVRILGDLPIFVAYDSADAWAHPELFWFDERGRPLCVAGVPPDYFSETGQLWGNPLYRWDTMAAEGYEWWIERIRAALELVDLVRVDHFIGFTRYWEIPAGADTAVHGRFQPGPGAPLLEAIRRGLGGRLPLVAEDLGLVTPEVEALREQFGLPGMKVLQFAFGGDPKDRFLPHNYERNFVAYTGTHDNDTTLGWFHSAPPEIRAAVRRYLGHPGEDIAWDMIGLAMASVADTCILPLQDILGLGSGARMNCPGKRDGNWTWRVTADQLGPEPALRLRSLAETYGRGGASDV